MKKVFVILLTCFMFAGCANVGLGGDSKAQSISGADVLVISNPTKKAKQYDEKWIKLKATSRSLLPEEDSSELYEPQIPVSTFVEHTLPFDTNVFKSLERDTSRAIGAGTKISVGFKVGEKHTFTDVYINKKKQGTLVYEGKYCYIWTVDSDPEVSKISDEEEIKAFADKFDSIYVKEIALCGPKYSGETVYSGIIYPNKKISVLLYDISEDQNKGNVYGYFAPSNYNDFQSGSDAIELICIDSYYAKQKECEAGLFSTLAHEFNHMLNYANKLLKYGLNYESWYTEMLSMITEDFFLEDLGVDYENAPESRLETFVKKGYTTGFGNWYAVDSGYTHLSYANAYAFGAYLIRNYGGAKLVQEMATNEFVNEQSVVAAVNKVNNLNLSFNDLLIEFPMILVNTKNENDNFPSLYKAANDVLDLMPDYTYKLYPVDLENLNPKVQIEFCSIDNAEEENLNSYGFQLYKFEKPAKIKLGVKNFLLVDSHQM